MTLTVKTVWSDSGEKKHAVIDENNSHGWVTVSCGHEHFEPPIETHVVMDEDDLDDIEELCQNCRATLEFGVGKRSSWGDRDD